MIGDIMKISRLRMGTDGKGVSTLVTFFDCPLNCKYCINNFCHDKDELGYESDTPRAIYTPKELIKVLEKDDIYYKMSSGGIVFGGGEPLLQSAFIHEVCKLSDPLWKKRIETSLNVPWRNVEPIISDIDEWIIDIKDMDDEVYEAYTGMDNRKVSSNLYRLSEKVAKSKLRIRVPRIPDFNDEKKVQESVKWIKDSFGVNAEVFDYIKTPEIKRYSWLDNDE